MRTILIPLLMLAACSPADDPERSPEGNLTAEAGSVPMPVPAVSPAVDDLAPPADALPTVSGGNDATETPFATPSPDGPEQSAVAAAELVRRYFRLIRTGDAAAAWTLWDDGGRASGLGRAEFARGFERFARYDAAIGRPGPIEGGAGQRYVEVPVAITGALKTGEPVALRGKVVLHRAGPIDGATAEQRSWRIARIDLPPRPTESTRPEPTPTPPGTATPVADTVARYRCGNGALMLVRFDRARDTADVELGGELLGVLDGQRPASGIWYKRGETELRGKGEEATISRPGAPELRCIVEA